MFSLVAFHNGRHSVVPSKNVEDLKRRMCIVKYNGAKYSAFFIKKSDDKSYLQEIKNKKEATEITCIAKLLMAAITDGEEVEDNNETDGSDDREDEEENEWQNGNVKNINSTTSDHCLLSDSFEEVNENSPPSQKKRRSTSPFGKTKRFRWSKIEKDAIYAIFGNIQRLEKLPTLNECLDAISQQPALRKRTPQQVKSWIDNQRRHRKPDESTSNI